MTTHTFRYVARAPVEPGATLTLDAADSRHLARVVRRAAGDPVEVLDPAGRLWPATVVDPGPPATLLAGEAPLAGAALLPVVLYLGLAEWGRIDTVAEKAAELGVRELVLVVTERVRRAPGDEAWERRRARIERVVEAAARQSGRSGLMRVRGLLALDAVLDEIPQGEGFLLDPRGEAPLGAAVAEAAPRIAAARLLVGPDTGLSAGEAERALTAGLRPVTLGAATLRAETAGIAAAAVAADALARAGAA